MATRETDERPGEITLLLRRVNEGDREAEAKLVSDLEQELRRLAAACLRGNRRDHTLQPMALVNEVYLKMLGVQKLDWQNRAHFLGVAARAMRQVLVDHARSRQAEKRGGAVEFVRLEEEIVSDRGRPAEILALDEALTRLRKKDLRAHQIVELRFFGGLSVEETAAVMGVSPRTVKRDWSIGRAWLRRELAIGSRRDGRRVGPG